MTQNQLTQGADSFFADLENDSPYLKACAEGLAKSGKTFTLALIAVGLNRHIKSEKPIVIFDTENAAKFLKTMFETAGIPVKVKSPLVETLNSFIEFNYEFDTTKSSGFPKRVMDISLAKRLIHYDPTTSLLDGLKETWTWFEKNQDEYLNKVNYFKE